MRTKSIDTEITIKKLQCSKDLRAAFKKMGININNEEEILRVPLKRLMRSKAVLRNWDALWGVLLEKYLPKIRKDEQTLYNFSNIADTEFTESIESKGRLNKGELLAENDSCNAFKIHLILPSNI